MPKLLVQLYVGVMGRAGVPGQLELIVFWLGQSHLQRQAPGQQKKSIILAYI